MAWLQDTEAEIVDPVGLETVGVGRAFRQGIIVEALNPKTAAFFLAFIPQFIDPTADVARQFVILGTISVALNTAADVVVTHWAAKAKAGLAKRPSALAKMRQLSGAAMCTLGASLLVARRAG
ncbi:LysE family translocator [Bradyrhizobium sp. WSM2254]|uniref:LysE family translocator n=1 Tax=Bradyrhizobium sp. WSM2254 TaxID=1188263 RepID=UPI003524A0DF